MEINQSVNAEFEARRYRTRPGAPAGSVKSTIKKYIFESFSKCTGISNIMKVGWKSVPGGWTGVEETTFILLFLAECKPLSQWTSVGICRCLQKLWKHSLKGILVLVQYECSA